MDKKQVGKMDRGGQEGLLRWTGGQEGEVDKRGRWTGGQEGQMGKRDRKRNRWVRGTGGQEGRTSGQEGWIDKRDS